MKHASCRCLWRQTRLEDGHYGRHAQVAEDIRQVWTNCKTYNQVR